MSYNYIKLPITIESVPQVSVDDYTNAVESPKLYTGEINVVYLQYNVDSPGLSGLWNIKIRDTFGQTKLETVNLQLSTAGAGELSAISTINLVESDEIVFDTTHISTGDNFTVTLSSIKYNYDPQYAPTPTPTPSYTPTPTPTRLLDEESSKTFVALNAGDTQIQLSPREQRKFPVGTYIQIAPGLVSTEFNEVVGHGSIILRSPLQYNHVAGTTIVAIGGIPTPTPTPTPTDIFLGSCTTMDPASAIGCNNSINWTVSSDEEIQFFEIYRACSPTEHYLPLSAYELIDVIYDPTARQYVDWYQPGCRICRYIIAAGNPRMTMMVPHVSAVGCVGPTCTPTPTPTTPCYEYDFYIGDPGGVRYVRVLSDEYTDAVKYVKCTDITDERYLPIIPPTPPVNPKRPYCLTPTPTPTFLAQEFDMCFPTPTPTPTPTEISQEFEFITPTPSPTPTPTPTAPYDGILVDGPQSCLSFIESRFNDNDYITVWLKSLTKPPHDRVEILCKKLLIPAPGLTYCVPMDLNEEIEVTVVAVSEGIYPPCTIDIAYDNSVHYKDIFLREKERFKFNMLRVS